MKHLNGIILTALIAAAPATALADGNGVTDQKNSISISFPNGGNPYAPGSFGLWMMANELINLGINVGLVLDTSANGGDLAWDILLAPAMRMYFSANGPVLPFWFGQVNFRVYDRGVNNKPQLGIAGGIGVEYFITSVLSVAAQTGVGIDLVRATGGGVKQDGIGVSSFTSNASANIYF